MKFKIPKDRFYVIALCLMLMWAGIMVLLYLKADEVTKDPCQICAKRLGEEVNCFYGMPSVQRIYHPDYEIEDVRTNVLP